MRGRLTNMTKGQVTVQAEIGQMWESGLNGVVLVRPTKFEIPAGKTADVVFETAATRSMNRTNEQATDSRSAKSIESLTSWHTSKVVRTFQRGQSRRQFWRLPRICPSAQSASSLPFPAN
jgi:hypothetical protein